MPDTNGPCQNCESQREAITKCPCGCKLWVCRRCQRSIEKAVIAERHREEVERVHGK